MNHGSSTSHPSAEQLQAFLEGELPKRELTQTEEHVAGCARCASELQVWRSLFEDLDDLSSHRPFEGFADRVMASVQLPQPRPLGQRVREGLFGDGSHHARPDQLQDLLDGVLAARKATLIEQHLEQCSTCADEAATWLPVFARLDGLDTFVPHEGFVERVMSEVSVPSRRPFAARIRARVASLVGAAVTEHVPAGILQDFVDGALPARSMARVQAHIGDCGACSNDVEAWRGVAARLDTLERFGPTAGFADRVMSEVGVTEGAAAVVRTPAWSHALAAARRLAPQTREVWAALTGIAVTPAVISGVVLYAVFSHSTLTIGSLLSFAWWQVTDMATVAFSAMSATALQNAGAFGASALFEALASAPMFVAGGVLAYSMVSALALRVLYRNLIKNRPSRRYAHVSAS